MLAAVSVRGAPRQATASGEIIVKFREGTTSADVQRALGRGRLHVRRHLQTGPMARRKHPGLTLASTDMRIENALAALRKDPAVEYAEPNFVYTHQFTSNDPYFGVSWGMQGALSSPANAYGSGAAEAWANGYVGTNTVYVAVIDDGMQITHPDLAPNVWVNPFDPPDGIDNDGNGYVDDVSGWDFAAGTNIVFNPADPHGTHVGGIIGAKGGNGLGVTGVNWNVTLIPLKFITGGSGYTLDAVAAIDYCVDLKERHGLNLVAINASWGGTGFSQSLEEAMIRAANAGILFIAAAGNSTNNNDVTSFYPANSDTSVGTLAFPGGIPGASYNSVITVAAIDSTGALASFSNYGATKVHLGAPGVNIASTYPTDDYVYWGGTSMAAPHVTGAVALYASTHPYSSPEQIRAAILNAAAPTPSLAGKTVTGGRLDISGIITPLDHDADGLPDDFEEAFNLNANDASDAAQDWDGDGFSNLEEYLAGTDPLDSESALRITGADLNGSDLNLHFNSVRGEQYSVEYNDSYPSGIWKTLDPSVSGTGGSMADLDAGASTVSNRVYRVKTVATGVTSESAGFYRVALLGNSDTLLSVPFLRPAAQLGAVASVSGATLQIRGVPAWTPGQWVYSSGTQTNTYFLLIRSGAQEGQFYTIVSSDADSVTLSLEGNSLSALSAGDRVAIVPYWTVGTIFSDGQGVHASTSPGNRQTEVLVPDIGATGVNLSSARTYYFWNGAWRQVGQPSGVVKNDDVILPDMFLWVRHNTGGDTEVLTSGSVPDSQVRSSVKRNSTSNQDNLLALPRPAALSLSESGLIESGAFRASSGAASPVDELFEFDNAATLKNKSAAATYYYCGGIWRKIGSGLTDVGTSALFQPGSGFVLRAGPGSSPAFWSSRPND